MKSAVISLIKIKWEIVKPNKFQTSEPIQEARAHQLLSDQDKLDSSQFKPADMQYHSGFNHLHSVNASGISRSSPTDLAVLCIKWIFCL